MPTPKSSREDHIQPWFSTAISATWMSHQLTPRDAVCTKSHDTEQDIPRIRNSEQYNTNFLLPAASASTVVTQLSQTTQHVDYNERCWLCVSTMPRGRGARPLVMGAPSPCSLTGPMWTPQAGGCSPWSTAPRRDRAPQAHCWDEQMRGAPLPSWPEQGPDRQCPTGNAPRRPAVLGETVNCRDHLRAQSVVGPSSPVYTHKSHGCWKNGVAQLHPAEDGICSVRRHSWDLQAMQYALTQNYLVFYLRQSVATRSKTLTIFIVVICIHDTSKSFKITEI